MNKYFYGKKIKAILFLLFIIIINSLITENLSNPNMRLEINYSGQYGNSVSQVFFDMGEGISEKDSCKGTVINKKAVVNIPNEYSEAVGIRFDPINIKENVVIENIKLIKYNR